MKKVLAVVLAVAMLFSLAGCASSSEAPAATEAAQAAAPAATEAAQAAAPAATEVAQAAAPAAAPAAVGDAKPFDNYPHPRVVEKPKVGFLVRTPDSESNIRSIQQAEIEVAHRGWELVNIVYEVDTNFRDAFQNAVNQDCDAIIVLSCGSFDSKTDLFADARNKGIGVYSNDNQIVDGIISNCTMPNAIAASELFYKVGEDYGWDLGVCIFSNDVQQICVERSCPVQALMEHPGAYPKMRFLATVDVTSSSLPEKQFAYETAAAWLQQYGDDVNLLWCIADVYAMPMAEAIMSAGDATGEKTFSVGFDGGVMAWSYIRNNTPMKYTYSQAFEYYTHNCFEIVNDIQVKGLNPGDEGCILTQPSQTLYTTGTVTTRENVPAVGAPVHATFGYYNPDDADAWYNWTDGPGALLITDYEAE